MPLKAAPWRKGFLVTVEGGFEGAPGQFESATQPALRIDPIAQPVLRGGNDGVVAAGQPYGLPAAGQPPGAERAAVVALANPLPGADVDDVVPQRVLAEGTVRVHGRVVDAVLEVVVRHLRMPRGALPQDGRSAVDDVGAPDERRPSFRQQALLSKALGFH